MSQKVVICKGIPASGKSTWAIAKAKEAGWKRVNKDELRRMLDGGKYSKGNEKFVLFMRDCLIHQILIKGCNVIVDDTNLYPSHERDIKLLVQGYHDANNLTKNYEVAVVTRWFPITLEDAMARDSLRENMVGGEVLRRMYKQYQKAGGPTPTSVEVVKQEIDPALPWCIICDLDGTLSKFKEKGHRGPFDASKCDEDDLNIAVADIVSKYNNEQNGVQVIFVSGRSDTYEEQTWKFLHKYGFHCTRLYMRKEGDCRKDSIIKQEIYQEYIKDKHNVLFVLDDRDQTVRMWRSLGLDCFQVNWGNF